MTGNQEMTERIAALVSRVREQKPLIHNITNYVTVNDCANAVLAIGASPIMADDRMEAAQITSIAKALVINTGTLSQRVADTMMISGRRANELGIPVILDPVGAGASQFRNDFLKRFLAEISVTAIRGNLSEVSFLAGYEVSTKGVDTSEEDEKRDRAEVAKSAASKYDCVVGITGAVDVVSDGKNIWTLADGDPRLTGITGSGCMTSALIGAFLAVAEDPMEAVAAGILTMSIAGELAARQVTAQYGSNRSALGSFHMAVLDAISDLSESIMKEKERISDETRD